MTTLADATLAYWKEHREQLRQSENQRATLTNYVLVITAALSGFIVQQGVNPHTLLLSVAIVAIGLYGALTVAKYHERAHYHLLQARALTRVLVEAGVLPDLATDLEEFRSAHYGKYRLLHRVRLHHLWIGLHVMIAAYGVLLVALTLIR